MKKLLYLTRRAATAPPAELYARTRQFMFAARNWAHAQRGGSVLSPRGHLRSLNVGPADLADWWRFRRSAWFVDVDRDRSLQQAASDPATQIPWVLQQAELVMRGRMPLFDYEPVLFEGTDRWHTDFILGKVSPRKFHGLLDYLDVHEVGDSKHTWEPNRFAWAMWLGVAYRVSHDRRYAEKFAELTSDWFQQNPYPIGINYCSSLELALRNYAWLWSLELFDDYLRSDPRLLESILRGIWVGCRHVEANLSTYFAPNTHLTGEGFGLFVCGAAIPEFNEAQRWRKLGQTILSRAAKTQIHDDGTHRELSSGYHIYSTDYYVHATLVASQTGFRIPLAITTAARQLAIRLAELAPNDLILPQFNDCDSGRLTCLVPHARDAGPTLIAAQHCHPDLDLAPREMPPRGYPLLMSPRTQSLRDHHRANARPAAPYGKNLSGLYDSGLVAYRNRNSDYVLFRATPFGFHDCPHSHDAALGIVVHLNGTPIFEDNGVGSYTRDLEQRNQFRGASGKNTMLVNQQGPSVPGGWFTWHRTTDCSLVSYRRFADGFSARGKHDGFSTPPDYHVFVQREVLMLDTGVLAIVDRWDADINITVRTQFTVSPRVQLDPAEQVLRERNGSTTVHFVAAALGGLQPLPPVYGKVPFSANYGQVGEADALAFEMLDTRRGGIVTILSRVGAIAAEDDRGFRFSGNSRILLQMTSTGVRPVRAGLRRAAVLLGSSG